jgi:hypothetical protein
MMVAPMLRAALPLALLVALRAAAADAPAAPPPAAPAAPPAEAAEPGTFEDPPAQASREDAALWRNAKELDVALPVERGVSTRLQAQVNGSRWEERLAAAVRRGTLSEKRATELRTELQDEWRELAAVLTARWPVDPTRVCGYPWLDFDNTLRSNESPFRTRELPQARARLEDCVEKATRVYAALLHANDGFRRAFERIDREAPALPPVGSAPEASAAK